MKTSRIAKAAVLAASLSLAAPLVLAQNVALVNGKGVPKARVDAMVDQILKQSKGQAQAPESAACKALLTTAHRWNLRVNPS
jgi:peptidyl-prolyl cis-trans isomerase C